MEYGLGLEGWQELFFAKFGGPFKDMIGKGFEPFGRGGKFGNPVGGRVAHFHAQRVAQKARARKVFLLFFADFFLIIFLDVTRRKK